MRILAIVMVLFLGACASMSSMSPAISLNSCTEKLATANATMCATDWVIWGIDCTQAGNLQQECSERLAKARAARGDAAVALVELEDSCPPLDTRHRDCAL